MPIEFGQKNAFKPVLQVNNEPEILTTDWEGNDVRVIRRAFGT